MRGFSLVELLVVLAIVGILLSVALLPGASALRARGQEQSAATFGASVAQNIAGYLAVNITQDPSTLISSWPAANMSGAPSSLSLSGAKDCALARSLGSFGWNNAPGYIGCAAVLDNTGGVARIQIYTWRKGSNTYYIGGLKQ